MKPDYSYAYNNRGFLKYQLKDFRGAISDYSTVIKIDPTYPVPYYNRGLAKSKIKDFNGALNDYNNAIKLKPNKDYLIFWNVICENDKYHYNKHEVPPQECEHDRVMIAGNISWR